MTTFDHLDRLAAQVREDLAAKLEAAEIGERLDAIERDERETLIRRYLRSVHPSTAVGFDELVCGMGVYREGEVWLIVTKRSDGWLYMRQEGTDRYEWVEAAGEPWHLAEPF